VIYPLAQQVGVALMGAVYPLTRDQLLHVARENDTPRSLLTLLSGLPPGPFRSLDDVSVQVDLPLSLAEQIAQGSPEAAQPTPPPANAG
jgi:hypothetical protein